MRPSRLLAFLLIAVAAAGCGHLPGQSVAPEAADRPPDLDEIAYGRGAPALAPAPIPVAAPGAARAPLRGTAVPTPGAVVVPAPDGVMPVMLPGTSEPYTLDSGDKLRIVVFGQDGLSNTYVVDAGGKITMPLIGAVTARDQTTATLAASIKSRLAQGYIREPSVAVEVELYRPFFVLGEVTYPGQYPFVPHMTVENAVAIAGGFTPRASKDKVTITRKIQGVPARFALPLRTTIYPGDVLTVGERWF
jgi:polysaccharide export outer membrane protein